MYGSSVTDACATAVDSSVQAIGIAFGWLAVPPGIRARLMPQSPLTDDIIIVLGTGVMRSVLSQVRQGHRISATTAEHATSIQ